MKILIDPNAELFDILYENKSTPYLFGLFRNLLKHVEYTGKSVKVNDSGDSIFLEQLDILVPSWQNLKLEKSRQRRTGIDKLHDLNIIEKLPSKFLPNSGKNSPLVVRLNVSCELLQFKFSYNDKYVSKYEGEEVTVNGVKFIKPEWLDLPEFEEDMMKWISHIRNRGKNIDREMFEDDLHKNFPDLFKFIQQECNEKPHIHNIYYASQNNSISKNNVINRCIEKGYTSFKYALSQKELLHNVVESSAKLSTNSKSKTVSKSSEIDINLAIHNTLKQLHESLVSKKDIAAFFSEKEDQKKLFFGHISNIQKLKKKSTELPEKYLSRLFALMTKKKEFYSDAQKRQLRDIYEVRRKKGELLRPDMTLKEFIKTCEELNVRPSEKETVKA